MSEDIRTPGERGQRASRDAQVRAAIYGVLAVAAVFVLLALALFGRAERTFAAGGALGLDDVVVALEQRRVDDAKEKLREIAPDLQRMGWDTTPDVDRALQRIRELDRGLYFEALRHLTGLRAPGPAKKPAPRTKPRPMPSAI